MSRTKLTTWRHRTSRGETLLEVLLAIVVLIIGATTATSLILSAMKANAFNKDSLIALNLAQEGIEYMRNLRDTNWLRFSADRDGCWNMRPDKLSCAPADLLLETTGTSGYALGDELGQKIASPLDFDDLLDDEAYRLKYFDLDLSEDSDGLNRDGDEDAGDDDYDFVGTTHSSGASAVVEDTKFFRRIGIEYYTIGDTPGWLLSAPGVPPLTADLMMISSTVQWEEPGNDHQITLRSALASYK
jgi:type II secretory pathway pseudopilin PulG